MIDSMLRKKGATVLIATSHAIRMPAPYIRNVDDPYFNLKDDRGIREYYAENGYVVIRGLIPQALCDDVLQVFAREVRTYDGLLYRFSLPSVESNKWTAHGFLTNPLLNLQSLPRALHAFRQSALNILTHDRLQQAAQIILGERPKLVQSMYFEENKHTPAHQDSYYLDAEAIGGLTACWFALEDIVPGAGRFFVCPGSHKVEVGKNQGKFDSAFNLEHYKDWVVQTIGDEGLSCHAPALAKGDVLFWNSKTIHGSLETKTPEASRRSFTGHYIPESSRFLQFQTRIRQLNIEIVNGMQVHKPKDMERVSTRGVMWLEVNFPMTFQLARKLAMKIVTG